MFAILLLFRTLNDRSARNRSLGQSDCLVVGGYFHASVTFVCKLDLEKKRAEQKLEGCWGEFIIIFGVSPSSPEGHSNVLK